MCRLRLRLLDDGHILLNAPIGALVVGERGLVLSLDGESRDDLVQFCENLKNIEDSGSCEEVWEYLSAHRR